MELTVTEIARNVHAHPTLSEAIMEAAHDAAGHAIHIWSGSVNPHGELIGVFGSSWGGTPETH